jgi:hypothetical protein
MSSGRPPPPLPEHIPAPIAEIARRTLTHSPDARYATAAELGDAIEKAMVDTKMITTAAQVAAFMTDLMGDRAEKRKESIALGLKAADEREKQADIMLRNTETPGIGSESGAGTPAGARILTASGGGPESQRSGSGTGQTLGGSAAMAVPTAAEESQPAAEVRSGRGKTLVIVAGVVVVAAAAAAAAVLANRKPEPAAATVGAQVPSASAPVASSAATPAPSGSSPSVDAAPSAAAAANQPASRSTVHWTPAPAPAPTPKPTPTATSKTRDNYGF